MLSYLKLIRQTLRVYLDLINDIKEMMHRLCEVEKYDLALLMVTDIVLGGTELIAIGSAKN